MDDIDKLICAIMYQYRLSHKKQSGFEAGVSFQERLTALLREPDSKTQQEGMNNG